MDKAEYQVRLGHIKELVDDQDYEGALKIVQTIEWKRVKSVNTLCMVADIYEANGMLEDCKRILRLAYNRAPIGKTILARLVELALKLDKPDEAADYYHRFVKAAPNDATKYLLKYKIYKAQKAPVEDLIAALRSYKDREYTERWAFELARLYAKAGMDEECVEECDDIILWFSEGVYVIRAMELKMNYTPLTPSQQEKYNHRYETTPELYEQKTPQTPPASAFPQTEALVQPQTAGDMQNVDANSAPPAQEDVFTSTVDLQERLSEGLMKVIGGFIRSGENPMGQEAPMGVEPETLEDIQEYHDVRELEPEQLVSGGSGVRREAVVTRPDGRDVSGGADMDFSAILEAQADMLTGGGEIGDGMNEAAAAREQEEDTGETTDGNGGQETDGPPPAEEETAPAEVFAKTIDISAAVRSELEQGAVPALSDEEMPPKAAPVQEDISETEDGTGGTAAPEAAVGSGHTDESSAPEAVAVMEPKAEETVASEVQESAESVPDKPVTAVPVPPAETANEAAPPVPRVTGTAAATESAMSAVSEATEAPIAETEPVEPETTKAAVSAVPEAAKSVEPEITAIPKAPETLSEKTVSAAPEAPKAAAAAEPKPAVPTEPEVTKAAVTPLPEVAETVEPKAAKNEAPVVTEEAAPIALEATGKTVFTEPKALKSAESEAAAFAVTESTGVMEAEKTASAVPEPTKTVLDKMDAAEDAQPVKAARETVSESVEPVPGRTKPAASGPAMSAKPEDAEPVPEKAAASAQPEAVREPVVRPWKPEVLRLSKEEAAKTVSRAEKPAPRQEPAEPEREALSPAASEELDLEALLASEIEQMVEGVKKPAAEPEPEKDLIARLEEEADRTIVHEEMVKETPQDKRYRIIHADRPNRLTEEQKRLFTYFSKIPGMDEQILDAIHTTYNGAVNKTSRHGNIAIMGRPGTGKTRLSEGLVRSLCKEFEMPAAKIARIRAEDLNEKDVAKVVSKMAGGFLIIEQAGRMSPETILNLSQSMEFRTDSMILLIEDDKQDMRQLLADYPEFAEKFDSVISIPVFTNDELVTFARTYAGERGYKMDEMGVLALYTIIGDNQKEDEPVSVAQVKEMVDFAIRKASRGGRRFGRKLSGRQTDENNRIILYEKDFNIK